MDAVCVANNQMELAVLHIASGLQTPVPQSLGVVGFDNIVRNVAGMRYRARPRHNGSFLVLGRLTEIHSS